MPKKKVFRIISRIIHWLLVVILLIYLITGLTINYFQIAESITFGYFSKLQATKIHDALLIPFVVMLVLHIVIVIIAGRQKIS